MERLRYSQNIVFQIRVIYSFLQLFLKSIYKCIDSTHIWSAQLNEFLQTEFSCVNNTRSKDRTFLVPGNPPPRAFSRHSLTSNRIGCFYLVLYSREMEPYRVYSCVSDFSWLHVFVIYLHHCMYLDCSFSWPYIIPICKDVTIYFSNLYLFIYLFLTVLGLCRCSDLSLAAENGDCSLAAEHGLQGSEVAIPRL